MSSSACQKCLEGCCPYGCSVSPCSFVQLECGVFHPTSCTYKYCPSCKAHSNTPHTGAHVAHHSHIVRRAPEVAAFKIGGDCTPHVGAITPAHMQGCRTSRGNAFSKKQYICRPLAYHDKTTSYNQAGNSKAMRSAAVARNPGSRGKIMQGTIGAQGALKLC